MHSLRLIGKRAGSLFLKTVIFSLSGVEVTFHLRFLFAWYLKPHTIG